MTSKYNAAGDSSPILNAETGKRELPVFKQTSGLKKLALCVGGVLAPFAMFAQTDATVIATNAQTAFGTIAPITITIAGFYVILRIAKRVVH